MFLKSKKGQSTLEYAIIIAVVAAALLAMQVYIKRGIQGKLRSSTDEIGEQYSPGLTTGSYTTTTGTTSTESRTAEGKTTTEITRGDQSVTGDETVAPLDQENWPE